MSSLELPSAKISSVYWRISGVRFTAASALPDSFRAATTTEPVLRAEHGFSLGRAIGTKQKKRGGSKGGTSRINRFAREIQRLPRRYIIFTGENLLASECNLFRANINPNLLVRADRLQEFSTATANFQNRRERRYDQVIIVGKNAAIALGRIRQFW